MILFSQNFAKFKIQNQNFVVSKFLNAVLQPPYHLEYAHKA